MSDSIVSSNPIHRWEVPSVCTAVVPRDEFKMDFEALVENFAMSFGRDLDHCMWFQVVKKDTSPDTHKFYTEILKAGSYEVNGFIIYHSSPTQVYENFDEWMASEASAKYCDNYLYLNNKIEAKETAKVYFWNRSPVKRGNFPIGHDAHTKENLLGIGNGSEDYAQNISNDVFHEDHEDYIEDINYEEDY